MTQTFSAFAGAHVPEIDSIMRGFLKKNSASAKLFEAMDYSVAAGGKRFRPLLLIAAAEFLGQPATAGVYQAASALEMIHTYSLIHDDLPAMDDDELRRGRPTNHKVFGEALAILAGDGLLTEAFHLVSQADLPAEAVLAITQLFANAAGANGMIAGQVLDIQSENRQITLETLQKMHRRKTGALIRAAVAAATALVPHPAEAGSVLLRYAEHLGMAFQIRDDLLDVIGDEQTIGKKTGADQALHKSTYVSLLGIAGAETALDAECDHAAAALQQAKAALDVTGQTMLDVILKELTEI